MLFDRRRTFVVNRSLQFGLLLTSMAQVGFLTLVVTLALFVPLVLELRHPDWDSPESANAALQLLYLHESFWLPALLALVAIALHSVTASHRIAGPLYRFRRVCEAMTSGILPGPVTLRKGDRLVPELDEMNAMLAAWRERLVAIQQEAAALRAALARHPGTGTSTRLDDADAARWDEIARIEARLRDALAGVTVEGRP